jgi:hypothetical protein
MFPSVRDNVLRRAIASIVKITRDLTGYICADR